MLRKINQKRMKGFTLIELLIVMAVLGVLAVVVLIAINPAEQLRRARDSGKISGVQQLGRAASAYFVAQGQYPTAGGSWISDMVGTGDIASVPASPATTTFTPTCSAGNEENDWCYQTGTDTSGNEQASVYVELEADQYTNVCDPDTAFAVFRTIDARGGWVCDADEPDATETVTYE
jgi:prepilin-type N-terminal cleavage/methylation domain-containing protein